MTDKYNNYVFQINLSDVVKLTKGEIFIFNFKYMIHPSTPANENYILSYSIDRFLALNYFVQWLPLYNDFWEFIKRGL